MTKTRRAPYGRARDKKDEIRSLSEQGLPAPAIAEKLDLTTNQVYYLRDKYEMSSRGRGRPVGLAPHTLENLKTVQRLGSEGLTGAQIAVELKLSRQRISQLCQRGGITLPVQHRRETDSMARIVEAAKTHTTTKAVAEASGLSQATVRKYNSSHKLKIEDNRAAHRRAIKERVLLVKALIKQGRTRSQICEALGWPKYSPQLIMFARRHHINLPYASARYRRAGKKIRETLSGRTRPLKRTEKT